MLNKKDNRTLNKSIDMLRITILTVLFGVVILLFVLKLFDLQVIQHEELSQKAVPKTYRTKVVDTSRGHIYDRNGNVLASNRKIYNVVVESSSLDGKDYNSTLLEFINFCNSHGIELSDNLPVSKDKPYVFDEDYIFDKQKDKLLSNFIRDFELEDENLTRADETLYKFLCERYGVEEDVNSAVNRKLVGLRYDMESNSFEWAGSYVLLYDIDEATRVLLSEHLHSMHGIEIATQDERYYNYDSLACHTLGRIGKLDASDVEEYVNQKGYAFDEYIGRDGTERAFEEYLHGTSEVIEYEIDEDNNIIGERVVKEGQNGYSVNLTLDLDIQMAAEKALKEQIDYARHLGMSDLVAYNGEDCHSGSVVVMNPKNGDILAIASYPSYNLNTFAEDIAKLNTDEYTPLVNRSTMGLYPPGSTFKIVTSIAALSTGTITKDTLIYDRGEYRAYDDYTPRCWVYVNTGGTHGYMSVKSAIENSCNYFFYQVGDKMGIDEITKYARLFGLGERTGVEIPESEGILASPEYRDSKGLLWNPGDTLQAAIGQSDNSFTPIQLCSYMCAVVNGGTRYKATLLDKVVDFETGEIVFENQPEVLCEIDVSPDTIELLKSAMKSVVVDGTARHVFDDYDYEVGGKTGTAQIGKGKSDTALFAGFAPYDDPEIAVVVVVENGDKSGRASEVARAVFDCYFEKLEKENESEANLQE